MIILSLFDGMSCGQIALKQMGVKVDKYYASEIDVPAIRQTQYNFPDTIQLGDVRDIKTKDLPKIDIVLAGSPCQGFSFAGKQLNFLDERSKLFFEFVRIWKEVKAINPNAKFLLENVVMKKEYIKVISDYMEVFPVMIDSSLVSAQTRKRLYWTNIRTKEVGLFGDIYTDIPQPEDRGIFIKDILQDESEVDEKYYLSAKTVEGLLNHKKRQDENGTGFGFNPKGINEKMNTLRVGGKEKDDVIKLDKKGNLKGNHSDMDILCVSMVGRRLDANGVRKDYDKSLPISKRMEAKTNGKVGCLTTVQKDNLLLVPEATKKGYVEIYPGDCVDLEHPNSKTRIGRKMDKKINTLMASQNSFCHYTKDYRLRRITPIEAARLQTIPDWYEFKYIDKNGNIVPTSDTQIYKMLGNGWTIEVIKHILSFWNKAKK